MEGKDACGDEPRILTTDLTTGFMRCLKFISLPHLLMLYEEKEIQGRARPYQQPRGGAAAAEGRPAEAFVEGAQ